MLPQFLIAFLITTMKQWGFWIFNSSIHKMLLIFEFFYIFVSFTILFPVFPWKYQQFSFYLLKVNTKFLFSLSGFPYFYFVQA